MADFTFFCFAIFVKWDSLVRIFLTKMGPMSEDFGEKVTHFGGTSPYALTCEHPPIIRSSVLKNYKVSDYLLTNLGQY